MKNTILAFLILIAAALGGLGVYQQKQLTAIKTQLADADASLKKTQDQLAERTAADEKIRVAEQKARVLQETLTQASAVSAEQSKQVSALEQSLEAAKTNSGGGLGKLFKDPAMKDMIKAQQKAFMGPLITKNYGAFFKELNLPEDQAAQIKELLQNKMLAGAEMGMSMLDGSSDPEQRKEMGKQVKEQTDAYNQQIKDLLGDDYTKFQTYEKGIPDRMSVGQFKDQVSGSATAMDAAQEQQLIQAMTDARSNFKWTTDYQNDQHKSLGDVDMAEMFNEDRLNTHAKEQEEFDRQMVERARNILNAEQLKSFEAFLTNQRNMQAAAMKMAGAMFGNKSK